MTVRNRYRKNVGFHKLKKQKDVSSVNRDCFQFISLVCETSADEVDFCSADSTRTEVIYTGSFNSELLVGYWLSLQTWTPVQRIQLLIENPFHSCQTRGQQHSPGSQQKAPVGSSPQATVINAYSWNAFSRLQVNHLIHITSKQRSSDTLQGELIRYQRSHFQL